jgi:hypothetical protein
VHELDPLARQVGKRREVRSCREPLSFEAAHLARRCCVTVSRCPADNPAHRRIVAQALGVVHVLISSKAAEHRLPQQADQRMTRGCASRTPLKLPSLRSWGARSRCLARRWRTTDAGRIGPPALTLSYYVETRGSSRPVSKSGPTGIVCSDITDGDMGREVSAPSRDQRQNCTGYVQNRSYSLIFSGRSSISCWHEMDGGGAGFVGKAEVWPPQGRVSPEG